MAILSADLKFFAAQYATDDAYGGGLMSGTVVQDGIASNVFPVASESDMNLGRVQLRKVYAAVLSANDDALVGASVNVYTPPSDSLYEFALFAWGDKRTTRSEAAAALAKFPYSSYTGSAAVAAGGSVSGSSPTYTFSGADKLTVGDRIVLGLQSGPLPDAFVFSRIAVVEAIAGASVTVSMLYSYGSSAVNTWAPLQQADDAPKVYSAATLTAGVGASDVDLPVSRLEVQIVPDATPYPLAPQGLSGVGLQPLAGMLPIFRAGEMVLIRNSSGSVSEVGVVEHVDYFNGSITLASGLANAYSTGAIVTSILPLGDMQAQVGSSFSQQTWTRTFSDSLIGNAISANYNRAGYPITVTNEGAETERWAIVFTSDTDFKLIGETLGQIASGDTSLNFAPLNPITNQPYFTIDADGWGTGWQAGNVLRLNTIGARAPFWALRTTSPVPTASTDSALMQIRGSY
jgi:hypothetical protein